MSTYTPPALNAVDFALTAATIPSIAPYTIGLTAYNPPSLNAVDFELTAFSIPTFPDAGFNLDEPDPPPPPPPPEPTHRDGGGAGFRGYVAYIRRPPELAPKKAKAKVIKKLTKRLKVTPQQAEYVFDWADSITAGLIAVQPWREMALDTSSKKLTKPEIRGVKSYWETLYEASVEVAEDEDLALLLF